MGNKNRQGFTIVELLIVVVVIAILAAISIVSYNGISDRAKRSAVQSAASQVQKKLLTHASLNTSGVDDFPASLTSVGINDQGGTSYQYAYNNTVTPKTFCVTATTGTISYFINNTTQTSPVAGACPGHGVGGVAAITNLSRNPRGTTTSGYEWLVRYGMVGSRITGASDGPTPGLSAYLRATYNVSSSGVGRGIDHLINVDLGTASFEPDRLIWPVTAGEPITVSSYTRSSVPNTSLMYMYRIHDGAGAWLTYAMTCPSINYTAVNTWVRLTCTITPTYTGHIAIATRYQTSTTWPAGSYIDETGFMLTRGSTVHQYADGNTTNWIWNSNGSSTGPPQ